MKLIKKHKITMMNEFNWNKIFEICKKYEKKILIISTPREKKMGKEKWVEKLRQALGVFLSGISLKIVEIPVYKKKSNKKIEDSLFEEILFMIKSSRKQLLKNRILFFFKRMEKNKKSFIRKQYKELATAYKYLLKHKKDLYNYMSVVKLGILDTHSTWIDPNYVSGRKRKYYIKNGIMVRNDLKNQKPSFDSCVFREPKNIINIVNIGNYLNKELYENYLNKELYENGLMCIEKIAKEMINSTEPFKGKAEFRMVFMNKVNELLGENKELQKNSKWIYERSKLMDKTWKEKVCIQKLKNSSTPKEED